ncbi:MAG TPA: radical SAM protein [Candidatus Binatia bacterium]|nr:radical SAM protein [Candidatus Binatia bacterium]
MSELRRVATQVVRGLPYLKKELARNLSLSTGHVFTTPITYYVIFSGKCNLACTFCTIYRQVEPIIPGEVMARIVRETKELSGHGYNISLSGGEPTIYKPLYETLKLAHDLGINFGFTTNALALTKENVKRILSYDPFNINVSIESLDPKINEHLRPAHDGTRRTLQGIDNILEEKERVGSRVSVIIKPTIMEQNYRTLPDLVRYFGKHPKVQINFQPYVGENGDPHGVRDFAALRAVFDELLALQAEGYGVMGRPKTFDDFYEYIKVPPDQTNMRHLNLEGHKRNCDIGLRAMTIFPNGDVYFCDFLKKPIGNIYNNSLSDIYYGDMANRQRNTMVYCDLDCQQTCKRRTSLFVKARAFIRMG